ncbi:hypothetical protein [Natronorubrum sp. DTA28]|uniref:hypothetical protein n=1 Tax=Natronorubrum sp. DTA28 TaxID=3447019 RepID=UPI003F860A77
MRRRSLLGLAGMGGAVSIAGCGRLRGMGRSVDRRFRIGDDGFECDTGEGFEPLDVRGVNLGMGKPGRFPGEAAITREEYDRWLEAIGELHATVIRVYTVHPPAFYEALAAYNRRADDPLYLLHGNWIGEQRLHDAGDAFRLSDELADGLRTVVDVVHGEATLPDQPGLAHGTFDTDVSNYVLGYVAGIEWPPAVVLETNDRNEPGKYEGTYLRSTTERPFERWLAGGLDATVAYETAEYGVQRPVAFTNWVTTDPLEHPYEPYPMEDAVSIDPDALVPTSDFEAGTFAAYHVYPYYPDLLNETPKYVDYIDHRGEPNSYAGYLDDLVETTDHPLVVAEFGVPASRGIAHRDVHGRDQGAHTEREQGRIVADMYEDIRAVGAAGALVFTWQDEWFKRTWNLQQFSDPDRRPFWSNVQTPEQRFGLLAFDPATAVSLDGSSGDWVDATTLTPADSPRRLDDGADASRELTAVRVTSDEASLSIRLEFADLGSAIDWEETIALVALGLTGRGNTTLPYGTAARTAPTDFLVRLAGPDDSRVTVDAYYDAFAARYGQEAGLDVDAYRERDSGRFTPIRMVLNRGYTVPPTGEEVPFDAVETGRLRYGNGNPDAPDYDSLTDVHVSPSANAVELRLPWLLLNVSDPSQRRRLGDVWVESLETDTSFREISVAAATYRPREDGAATSIDGETNLTHAVPGLEGDRLRSGAYEPPTWTEPAYTERLKRGYETVQMAFDPDA